MPTRREFLQQGVAAAAGVSLTGPGGLDVTSPNVQSRSPRSFIDLHRQPDSVVAQLTPTSERPLRLGANGRWEDAGVSATITPGRDATVVALEAPATPVRKLRFRWRGRLDDVRLILGDAWERGYGDLEWRGFVPDRVMPWYVATSRRHASRTRTACAPARSAFCFWQVDPQGITLVGGRAQRRRRRRARRRACSTCATSSRGAGRAGESAFAAVHAFCRADVRESAAAVAAGLRQQRLVLGVRQEQRRDRARRRAAHRRALARGRESAVRGDRRRLAAGARAGARPASARGIAATRSFRTCRAWRREIRQRRRAAGHLDSSAAGAGRRARHAGALPRDRAILDPTVPEVRAERSPTTSRGCASGDTS